MSYVYFHRRGTGVVLLRRSADSGAVLLDGPRARDATHDQVLPTEQLSWPRHIYVTREDVRRVDQVLAKVQIGKVVPLRLHFKCECRDGEHPVENQPGRTFFVVDRKFAIQQGFIKAAVSVGALARKAGGTVLPDMSVAGDVVGSVAWFQGFPVYDDTLESLSQRTGSTLAHPTGEEELRALVEEDLQQCIPGAWMKEFFNRDTNLGFQEFKNSFWLTEVVYANTSATALLCERHCPEGRGLGLLQVVK